MSLHLARAFYAQAMADSSSGSFRDRVGQLWFDEAPQNAALPVAIYQVGDVAVEQFQTSAKHTVTIDVDVFVKRDYGEPEAQAIDDALFTACEGARVETVTGFDRATILCRSRGAVETLSDSIRVSSTWQVLGWTS